MYPGFFLSHLLCFLFLLSIRPVTVSLLSIRGPSRCEPSLTWRLQVSGARRVFSRQVPYRTNCSGLFVCVFFLPCVSVQPTISISLCCNWKSVHINADRGWLTAVETLLQNHNLVLYYTSTVQYLSPFFQPFTFWQASTIPYLYGLLEAWLWFLCACKLYLYFRHYLMRILSIAGTCYTLNKLNSFVPTTEILRNVQTLVNKWLFLIILYLVFWDMGLLFLSTYFIISLEKWIVPGAVRLSTVW